RAIVAVVPRGLIPVVAVAVPVSIPRIVVAVVVIVAVAAAVAVAVVAAVADAAPRAPNAPAQALFEIVKIDLLSVRELLRHFRRNGVFIELIAVDRNPLGGLFHVFAKICQGF